MILLAVFNCEVKKTSKFAERVRKESCVICQANSRDNIGANINSKRRMLCCGELDIVAKFVDFVRVNSTLFNTKGILNGSHEDFVPFHKCFPLFKPGVNVE